MSVEELVAKLQVQQESMAEDVRDMKSALTSIAKSLEKLSVLEQKQMAIHDNIQQHSVNLEKNEALNKDEFKGHERRIQAIEITLAKNIWVERVFMVVVMTVVGAWAKGIF